MPDRLQPPFAIRSTDEAYWVQDSQGLRFGYVYFREVPLIGTDKSGRMSRALALRTVKWIARMATEAAKT